MEFFPVFMRLRRRSCVIVGGGEVAARKAAMLRRAGAAITVVAPTLCPELKRNAEAGTIRHVAEPFRPGHLENATLAIAATDQHEVNQEVAKAAHALGIPVNVVDAPALSSFISPAVIDRSPVVIALSSGGAAPVLTRLLREPIETLVPAAYGRLASLASSFRNVVKQRVGSFEARRRFWERVFRGPVSELVFSGQEARAEQPVDLTVRQAANSKTASRFGMGVRETVGPRLLARDKRGRDPMLVVDFLSFCFRRFCLRSLSRPSPTNSLRELNEPYAEQPASGEVYLIGGGPGDPELLTLRALRLLQQADVVVYDHLAAGVVVELARRDAQRIYVGKESGYHTLPQPEVNALLIALARQGKRVARLKGGDPYIFGRGGEEAEALAAQGIPFQVVPGITAACGIAASTGVPLTHRDYAHSCVLVTGHLKDGSIDLDWEALARPDQTIAIYMGLKGLPVLCRELIAHGLPPATPAMVVQKGTTPDQRAVVGTLESLPCAAAAAALTPPTLVIVGEVVKLRARLGACDAFADRAAADIDRFTTAIRA